MEVIIFSIKRCVYVKFIFHRLKCGRFRRSSNISAISNGANLLGNFGGLDYDPLSNAIRINGENKVIKANNFVNILNATTNIANALGYGGKLFVKSYEITEGDL